MKYFMCFFQLPLTILSLIEYDLLGESRYFMDQKRDVAASSSTTYTLDSRKYFELLDTTNIPSEYRTTPPKTKPSARDLEPYKELVSAALESSLPDILPRLAKSASRPNIFEPPDRFSEGAAFRKGSDLETCINAALEALHRTDLSRKERIWTLTILDGLQAYLPRGELQPMRTDILEGPVRRGAFELHLIRGKGIELLPIAQRMWNPKAAPTLPISLIEALQRAELLAGMQKAIKTKLVPRLSQSGKKLHDMLVQAALPLDKRQAVKFVSTFEEHWSRHLDLSLETRWAYDILNHILRYDVNVKRYTEWQFTIDGFFKANSKNFWASTVKADILRIIRKVSNNPYITNILQPFRKDTPADFFHFKHVVDSFKVQNHAIQNFQEQQYGIPPSKVQEYLEDQNVILGILYKSSAHHPQEVVPYLNSELDYENHLFRFKRLPDFDDSREEDHESECSICMQQFLVGQRVLRLQCAKQKTHDFHEQCLRPWLNQGQNTCPYCRQTIKLRKFTQYVFWSENKSLILVKRKRDP